MTSIRFVICLKNKDYPISLEKRKIYKAIPDPQAERIGHIRIVDESGKAYLYPCEYFIYAGLSGDVQAAWEQRRRGCPRPPGKSQNPAPVVMPAQAGIQWVRQSIPAQRE